MLVFSATVVATFVALTNALPSLHHVSHEKRDAAPSNWRKGARIEGDALLPMRIGLTQTNLNQAEEFLREVSHPNSPKYGQHWTMEQVHDMFAPSDEAVEIVKAWLISSGIEEDRIVHHDNKGWLAFDASAEEAESLLLTQYHEHEHTDSSKIRVGCDEYHVPAHIQEHIDYITPGIKLTPVVKRTVKQDAPSRRSIKNRRTQRIGGLSMPSARNFQPPADLPADLQYCSYNITPACYRALYQIPMGHSASPGNSLGLYEQSIFFSESDVNLFFANYAPYVPQNTFPVAQLIDGASYSVPADSPLNSGETDIDINIATALVYPQTVTLYQVDDDIYAAQNPLTTSHVNNFLDALDGSYCNYTAFGETSNDPNLDPTYPHNVPGGYKGKLQCGVYKPTQVISTSYGQAETDLPLNYQKRQCNEFMKLALQGHSLLVAAGDYGVASLPGDSGSASGCLGPDQTIFSPQYPVNCPWLTSVGGTMLYPGQTVNDAESALQINLGGDDADFSSSGGFSNYYPLAWYQKEAVESYFAHHNPPYPYYSELNVNVNTTKGLYNRIGRAFPDVAANGAYLPTYVHGSVSPQFGTSLATPLFASVINLINEERYAVGKGPVGFLNSVLYAHPWVLNDIVNGTNLGCGSHGFQAVPGWDPVTGLGTPNYPKMKELFLSLP